MRVCVFVCLRRTGLRPERGEAVPHLRVRRPGPQEVHGGNPGHARPHVGQGTYSRTTSAQAALCFLCRRTLSEQQSATALPLRSLLRSLPCGYASLL